MESRREQISSEESKVSNIFSQPSISSCGCPTEPVETAKPNPIEEESGQEDDEYEEFLLRDLADIDFREFDPIWVKGEPAPEGLSEEVKELVNIRSHATIQMVGSMRTILHMAKCDDIVSLIDDTACRLEDDLIIVPEGTSPKGFLFRNYLSDDVIPQYFVQKHLGFSTSFQTIRVFPVLQVPSAVTGDLKTHRIQNIYPHARPQCLPENVPMVHLKWQKDTQKFATTVDKAFDGYLREKPGLFFRGLSLRALALSMTFFIPVVDSRSADNEFGPGIYTSENFELTYDYSQPNGAIMVFANMDVHDLDMWRPNEDEWNYLVATWLALPLDNAAVSPNFKQADIITGPISIGQREALKKKSFPAQNKEVTQSAFVSYKSCERLMASLTAIIYVSR